MKAETLKKSILQYAMEGKLVPQNPNDEPANELLKRIKAEKEQLIKEGKLKKEKPLPPITEEERPFELPQGWEWVRFQDITKVLTCGYASTPQYYEKGRIFLSAKNIKPYKFMPNEHKFISEELYQTLIKNGKPEIDDILLTRVGAGIGEAAIVDQELDFAIYVSLTLIKLFKNEIYPKYILHWLNSPMGTSKALQNTYGKGCSQGNLNVNQVRLFLIPLPPIEEQKRIVDKLEQILPLVDEYGKNEELLSEMNSKLPKQIRQSILQYAVQGKLVEQNPNDEPASELLKRIKAEKEQLIKDGKLKKEKPLPPITDEEKLFELPQGWEWVRLKDVVYNHGQKTPDIEFSYIDIGSINNQKQKLNEQENIVLPDKAPSRARKIIKNGDILYSTVRPYLHNMSIVDKEFSREPIASTGFAVMHCYNGLLNKFLFYYLLSPNFDNYANNTDNSKGVAYPAINDEKLYKAVIPLPPLEEQKRIVAKVDELMRIVNKIII